MLFTLIFCLAGSACFAQQDSSRATITFAAIYNSNINYYGQVTSEKYPYILANATFTLPIGLYFSAGAYRLLTYGSGISETDLGIGYEHDLSESLNVGLAYTHSFFPASSPLLQASNANNINSSITKNWPVFKSALNLDYAFGKQNDFFVSLANSKEIELGNLFNDKNTISIEPALEITAGTTNFYETYLIEKRKRSNSAGNGKSGSAPGIVNSQTGTVVETLRNSFHIFAYSLKLPLVLSRGNYLAELSYQFSVLSYRAEADSKAHQSFFGLSIYYQL